MSDGRYLELTVRVDLTDGDGLHLQELPINDAVDINQVWPWLPETWESGEAKLEVDRVGTYRAQITMLQLRLPRGGQG